MRRNTSHRERILALALAPLAALWADRCRGQTVTWDALGANPAAPTDGNGNWDTNASLNWTDGLTDFAWVNGDIASIGNNGTAGTITIDDASGTVTAAGINFNPVSSGSYTIAALGSDTLTLTGGINVATSTSATIIAPIAGSAGLALSGGGTLALGGVNTFGGTVNINNGALIVNSGGNLGSTANAVALGTVNNGTSTTDATGTLILSSGVTTTIGSFQASSNNSTGTSSLVISTGATLNVNGNLAGTGVNAVFAVGGPTQLLPNVTNLVISGGGSLNVTGGSANSSFVVGQSANNTSTAFMQPVLDMSGLSTFSFVTGTGALTPGVGGNEFLVGVGSNAKATATLAINSSITASEIDVGDNSIVTPGLSGGGSNNSSNVNTLNLGSGANVLNVGTILIGLGRSIGNIQFGGTTGSLVIAGSSGGASTANITVGVCSGGTPASSASTLALTGHTVNIQAGTVTIGQLAGGSGGTSATKGGSVSFDTGTFSIANVQLALVSSGTSGGSIAGTLTVGTNGNSTGVLNVTNSFSIADFIGGSAAAKGSFNIKGGTANIHANIIDTSSGGTSNTLLALTGGTLNMNGFAIGPSTAVGNAGTVGTRHITTITFPTNSAVLANLGGTGINDAGLTLNSVGGTLIMEGNNTYTGGTTVTAGALQVGQPGDTVPLTQPLGATANGVVNNASLNFGSNQPVTIPNVISGTGTVSQIGSGTTTLNASNTYGGVTSMVNGVLAASNIANGGTNSSIGASSNAAGNVVLTGGTLQYTGAGATTDRLFSVTPTGGALDASGAGPLILSNTGAVVSADPAPRATTDSITTAKVTLPSVADLVIGMSVTGTNIPPGTTIISITPTANSITLSNIPTLAGPDTLSFSTTARNLTLTGSNAGGNTLNASLSDSAGGGTLGLIKAGLGAWTLTANNSYSGNTTVNGGTLILSTAGTNNIANSPNINVAVASNLDVTGVGGGFNLGAHTLTNNGNVFGNVTAPVGSTIKGNGTFNHALSASGTIAPGNSGVGTLTVATLSLNSASLSFKLDNTGADRINVTGGLSLAGVSTFTLTDLGGTVPGTYALIDYTGTPLSDLSNFSLASTTLGAFTVQLVNNTANTSVDLNVIGAGPTNAQWAVDADGSWSVGTNWTGGTAPNGVDAVANFGPTIQNPHAVTVDLPQMVGTMNFNSTGTYTISGPGILTLDVSTGSAAINVIAGSHTISAPIAMNDNTGVDVASGSTLTISGNLTGAAATLTKTSPGMLALKNLTAAGLNVSGGKVQVSQKGANTTQGGTNVVVQSLSISSGAQLDLTNNSMVIDYTTVGTLVNDTRVQLQSGLLATSLADSHHALGYGDNAILGKASFNGTSVDSTSILVKYTYAGDTNLDGKVDVTDLGALSSHWQQSGVWTGGDFNYDGTVNVTDLGVLASNWQQGVTSPLLGAGSFQQALQEVGLGNVFVPEPGTLILAGLGIAGAMSRRRSRR